MHEMSKLQGIPFSMSRRMAAFFTIKLQCSVRR